MLEAICREIDLRRDDLGGQPVSSIYFGGGTPSVLPVADLLAICQAIIRCHTVEAYAEVTIEANPDDISARYLEELSGTPVNRISLGVQSFDDTPLRYMNRAHNSRQALEAIHLLRSAGYTRVSVDLIYGVPGLTDIGWLANLATVVQLDIPHLSCYALTVEDKTLLAHRIAKGLTTAPDEAVAERQFYQLMDFAADAGFEHYEISNLCHPGCRAVHNTSYWTGSSYLGLGPSAHSYDGQCRSWNISSNGAYIKALASGQLPATREVLTPAQRYNEYIMTALRTSWGCRLAELEHHHAAYAVYFVKGIRPYVERGWVSEVDGHYILTRQGRLFADRVAAELFEV